MGVRKSERCRRLLSTPLRRSFLEKFFDAMVYGFIVLILPVGQILVIRRVSVIGFSDQRRISTLTCYGKIDVSIRIEIGECFHEFRVRGSIGAHPYRKKINRTVPGVIEGVPFSFCDKYDTNPTFLIMLSFEDSFGRVGMHNLDYFSDVFSSSGLS